MMPLGLEHELEPEDAVLERALRKRLLQHRLSVALFDAFPNAIDLQR